MSDFQRLGWKLSVSVIYSLVLYFVLPQVVKYLEEHVEQGRDGGKSSHDATIRSFVLRPSRAETLARIGGLRAVKRELRRAVIVPMRHPSIFYDERHKSVRPPSGILLHGPPGTGKTMLARAVAAESGVPFLSLHSAALESKWYGESPKLLQAAFTLARTELAPCIVFFDEIDGMGRSRSELDQACVYSFKCELLRNMDGVEASAQQAPVLVLACTNCVQSLDPALRRRFPRIIHIDRPDERERLDILRKLTADDRTSAAVLRKVARATEGASGADLAARYKEATLRRMNALDVEGGIRGGNIRSGDDLVREIGPLTWEHWKAD